MTALIKGCFRLSKSEMEAMTEDEYFEAWGQAQYYLETALQVKFS